MAAKITEIRAHALNAKLARAFVMGTEAFGTAGLIVVEVRTDAGVSGIGLIHGRAVPQVMAALAEVGPVLQGMAALEHLTVWEKVFGATRQGGASSAVLDVAGAGFRTTQRTPMLAAMAGIDFALWDLKGKLLGEPVYRLLGATKRKLRVYASGGYYAKDGDGTGPFGVVEEMAGYVQAGFKAVKMKVGGAPLAIDVERVKRVREAIGGAALMLDASRSYALPEAMAAARAFEPFDITWFEEPLEWYDSVRGLAPLAQASHIPLASGESEPHAWACRDLVDTGAVRFLNFDGTRNGGATEWLRIAAYADLHAVVMTTHHAPHIQGHLTLTTRHEPWIETFVDPARDPFWDTLYTQRASIVDGQLELLDAPGFGIEIDWKAVEHFRMQS
ncbi:MAG: mandelate racemase/muconate lactonizing enzyme family protein [Pseudomonadota bacterium]